MVTDDGDLVALDAKMNFDATRSTASPRSCELRDLDEEDPHEIEASRHELNYIKLDGNIGCMVNGAGLAMATMDIIKLYGGEPANFLDVGGGATKERVTAAFKLLLSDPKVEGVLVNIFGGIMRCDVIAEGIVAAAREVNLNVPLVVRLEGTNVELGKQILSESGLPITAASDLADAAAEGGRCRGNARPDVGPGRSRHQGHLPGLHRRPGHVPLRAGDRVRHPHGRRRDARQGRRARISACRCSTPWRRRSRRPAPTPR